MWVPKNVKKINYAKKYYSSVDNKITVTRISDKLKICVCDLN